MAREHSTPRPKPDSMLGFVSGSSDPRIIDLTGQRYGRLTVLERAPSEKRIRWRCQCDCGEFVDVLTSNLRQGQQKSCGCLRVEAAKRLHPRFGEDHQCWKGTEVGYEGIHLWVRRHKAKTGICASCHRPAKRTHWANISGEYLRDLNDYEELCPRCHAEFDRLLR